MVGIEKLLYLIEDKDRYGKTRLYIRIPGRKKVRVPPHLDRGTEEFALFYWNIRRGEAPLKPTKAKQGSFRWLVEHYYASQAFADLDETYTQVERKRHLDPLVAKIGDKPAIIPTKKIREALATRERSAQRKYIAALRHVYEVGVRDQLVDRDPTFGIKVKKPKTDGFHSWTLEQCLAYEKRWPVGTLQRKAYALGLYLGCRRSDAVRIGRQHERANGTEIVYTQHKLRARSGVTVEHPIVPPLREALDAHKTKGLLYLETVHGNQRSDKAFGGQFADWCEQAGLPAGCSFHGLRKALSARLAEMGATTNEINAVLGDKTLQQAEVYTRAAAKKAMATKALTGLFGKQKVQLARKRTKR